MLGSQLISCRSSVRPTGKIQPALGAWFCNQSIFVRLVARCRPHRIQRPPGAEPDGLFLGHYLNNREGMDDTAGLANVDCMDPMANLQSPFSEKARASNSSRIESAGLTQPAQ